jgi:hypothetical protein
MAVEVALTRGGIARIDEADLPLIAPHKWHLWHRGAHRYATATIKRRTVGMHRLIMAAGAGQLVDHIDGDGLNNTRPNLRFVSRRENRANSVKRRAASSSYKGVYRFGGGWRAQIAAVGLPTNPWYIGTFDTEHDAAVAYDAFARLLFGDYAKLNYPNGY